MGAPAVPKQSQPARICHNDNLERARTEPPPFLSCEARLAASGIVQKHFFNHKFKYCYPGWSYAKWPLASSICTKTFSLLAQNGDSANPKLTVHLFTDQTITCHRKPLQESHIESSMRFQAVVPGAVARGGRAHALPDSSRGYRRKRHSFFRRFDLGKRRLEAEVGGSGGVAAADCGRFYEVSCGLSMASRSLEGNYPGCNSCLCDSWTAVFAQRLLSSGCPPGLLVLEGGSKRPHGLRSSPKTVSLCAALLRQHDRSFAPRLQGAFQSLYPDTKCSGSHQVGT